MGFLVIMLRFTYARKKERKHIYLSGRMTGNRRCIFFSVRKTAEMRVLFDWWWPFC